MRRLRTRVAVGATFMIAARVVIRGLSIIGMLVMVRMLAPEDFGIVALAAYLIIPAYRYNLAISLVHAERYSEASQVFGSLTHYRDSDDQMKTASLQAIKRGQLSDIVYFGRYESDNKPQNGKEPIQWRALNQKDGSMLLLADRILDIQPYHKTYGAITWEESTLRTWLNETFVREAFSEEERSMIQSSSLHNNDNEKYFNEGGNPTVDRVFILSTDELEKYLPVAERGAKGSWYANVLGWNYYRNEWLSWKRPPQLRTDTDLLYLYVQSNGLKYFLNKWWVRTPGWSADTTMTIQADGLLNDRDRINWRIGVRPAIRIRYSN